MNLEIHDDEPVNHVLQLLDTVILDDKITQESIMTVQKHTINTEDSFI